MTPAERDRVRELADVTLRRHGHAGGCACDACASDRAVLRYVPPGDVPIGFDGGEVTRCTFDDDGEVKRGVAVEFTSFDPTSEALRPETARAFAHALHAAADAAEETDR